MHLFLKKQKHAEGDVAQNPHQIYHLLSALWWCEHILHHHADANQA